MSSLLAQDDPNDGPPSLGGGFSNNEDPAVHHRSPLEELIEEARAGFPPPSGGNNAFEVVQDNNDNDNDRNDDYGHFPPTGLLNHSYDGHDNPHNSNNNITDEPYGSYVTLVASMFCVLQVGFVWGSFLSPSWLDTHLLLELPAIIKTQTDRVVHSTTLASLVSNLLSSDPPQHWAATALMITSLVVPCLICVCGPAWTYLDRKEAIRERSRWTSHRLHSRGMLDCLSPRSVVEYMIRVAFLVFFLLTIIAVGTSSMEINSNSTRFVVNNQIRGGLASYAMGMTCALLVVLLLRSSKRTMREITTETDANDEGLATAPPDRAFQVAWDLPTSNLTVSNADTHVIEEELQTPLISNDGLRETRNSAENMSQINAFPFWKKAIVYELCVLAALLWIPALFLPLFHLTYEGIIADFMTEAELSIRFYEFLAAVVQRCEASGTDLWITVSIGCIIGGLVYVGPVLGTVLCISTWTVKDPATVHFCYKLLGMIQPLLCGLVFCFSLQIALPAFETVSEYAIDMGSNGICQKFEIITSDSCFAVVGKQGAGMAFLWAQSISLELLVMITLLWKRKSFTL